MTATPNSRPRVIFIGPVPPPHIGPTLATEVLLQSKLNEQFELIHLDTSDPRDIESLGAIDLTNVWLGVKSYFQLIFAILRYRPKIVYIPISQTTLGYLRDSIYIWIGRLTFCKVVCHLRGGYFRTWIEGANPLTRFYVKRTHNRVHGQIVLGECLKPLFDGYVRDASRLYVVPNGKDYDATPTSSLDEGSVRVLFLANIIRSKGVMDALECCKLIGPGKGIEFAFAGAYHEDRIREEIEDFLSANSELPIDWVGPVSGAAKKKAFESADIFIFPTYYPPEGHPWVVIEAMAAGLPVISTDQGAIRESVVEGVTGFLIEKRNPRQLAEKIELLAKDGTARQRMSAASRARYLEQFTESRMVDKMSNAFEDILSHH